MSALKVNRPGWSTCVLSVKFKQRSNWLLEIIPLPLLFKGRQQGLNLKLFGISNTVLLSKCTAKLQPFLQESHCKLYHPMRVLGAHGFQNNAPLTPPHAILQ